MGTIPLDDKSKAEAVERVLDYVRHRLSTSEAARLWIIKGSLPGYDEKTPIDLISEDREECIYDVLPAIEAGVHA